MVSRKMSETSKKGNYGENWVIQHLKKTGDFISKGKRGCGYDILAKQGKIEVKTSEKTYGTPQFHENLFKNKKLKANFLYIVRITKNKSFKYVDVFTKKQVDKYSKTHIPVTYLRINKFDSDFKKRVLKPYKIINKL